MFDSLVIRFPKNYQWHISVRYYCPDFAPSIKYCTHDKTEQNAESEKKYQYPNWAQLLTQNQLKQGYVPPRFKSSYKTYTDVITTIHISNDCGLFVSCVPNITSVSCLPLRFCVTFIYIQQNEHFQSVVSPKPYLSDRKI